MGHVYVDVIIYDDEPKTVRALVYTGATYTVISRKLAEELGIKGLGNFINVFTAKGFAKLEEAMVTMEIMGVKKSSGLNIRRYRLTHRRSYSIRSQSGSNHGQA